jgi:hypothetical protein
MRIQYGGRVARNVQHLSVMRFADHCRDAIHGSSASEGLAYLAPAKGYHFGLRMIFHPAPGIEVPSDRNDRRNPLETGDDVRRIGNAGVDDVRRACEALLNLRT